MSFVELLQGHVHMCTQHNRSMDGTSQPYHGYVRCESREPSQERRIHNHWCVTLFAFVDTCFLYPAVSGAQSYMRFWIQSPDQHTNDAWSLSGTFMAWSQEVLMAALSGEMVYLFLSPLKIDRHRNILWPTAYWSADPAGERPLSSSAMKTLDLPKPRFTNSIVGYKWRARHYRALLELYQGCGFNPYSDEVSNFLGAPVAKLLVNPESDWRANHSPDHESG
jgi:hypothetical protein